MAGWKLRCLSKASRITLKSSVLNYLPVFHMQIIKMSEQTFKALDRLVGDALGETGEGRSTLLVEILYASRRPREVLG